MDDWATYLFEIRSPYVDWQRRFDRELGYELSEGVVYDVSRGREGIALYEMRAPDDVRARYAGAWWTERACPFVGEVRAVVAVAFQAFGKDQPRRFGCAIGRAARGLVLDLGAVSQRRPVPLVHRTVEHGLTTIDLARVRDFGASRAALWSIFKYGSDRLVYDEGPYADYVVDILADIARTESERRDECLVPMWRYTSSFTNGDECYLFD